MNHNSILVWSSCSEYQVQACISRFRMSIAKSQACRRAIHQLQHKSSLYRECSLGACNRTQHISCARQAGCLTPLTGNGAALAFCPLHSQPRFLPGRTKVNCTYISKRQSWRCTTSLHYLNCCCCMCTLSSTLHDILLAGTM